MFLALQKLNVQIYAQQPFLEWLLQTWFFRFIRIPLSIMSLFLIYSGISQFVVWLFVARRAKKSTIHRASGLIQAGNYDGVDLADKFTVYFLVPCLNEELVIERTVTGLLSSHPHAIVVVVDDGSDDKTAELAKGIDTNRVLVLSRVLPNARQGKGLALNDGFRIICDDVVAKDIDPNYVVVCVMDADGTLSKGAVPSICRLFIDKKVGGVQLPVSIRNRGTCTDTSRGWWKFRLSKILTTYQDYEFFGLSARGQVARAATKTVSLGGNAQFTRLTALQQIGPQPWSQALTEDLDLAITLLVQGWDLSISPTDYVEQQGVESLRALIKQRTRWMQGHILSCKRIPELFNSKHLSTASLLEVVSYLIIPIGMILPWSIVFNLGLIFFIAELSSPPPIIVFGSHFMGLLIFYSIWYLISFFTYIISGYVYYRTREKEISVLKAFLLSHFFLGYMYIAYIAVWSAVFRILRGKNSWVKTKRVKENA